MKNQKLLYLSLFLIFSLNTFAYYNLSITDPRGWSGSYSGNIQDVEVMLTPKGSYMQYDITMTIAINPGWATSNDTLEATLEFDLPKDNLVNDSWLWIYNYISKAKLIERSTASNIYEGIVRRRRDPSILTKTEKQYTMKIFPILINMPRKIKISYLVPMNWGKESISCPIPISIFKKSTLSIPPITFALKNDPIFTNYTTIELGALPSMDSTKNGYKYYTLPSSQYTNLNNLNIKALKMISNEILTYYSISPDEGYFETIIDMKDIISPSHKKLCLVLENANTTNKLFHNTNEYISFLKNSLLQNYNENDSFMLVYSNNGPIPINALSEWTAINSTNINSYFNTSLASNITNSFFNTKQLLETATNNIHAKNRGGEILLLSNLNNRFNSWDPLSANDYFNSIKPVIDSTIKINIINYYGYIHYSSYNLDYYSNARLDKLLTAHTRGYYNDFYTSNACADDNNYYSYSSSINANILFNTQFLDMSTTIPFFNFDVNLPGGHIIDKYESHYGLPLKEKSIVRISGKYYGSNFINTSFNLFTDSGVYSNPLTTLYYFSDSTVKQSHFANKYLIPSDFGLSSISNTDIINMSIDNRVLCNKTAFLALENIDTTQPCTNCTPNNNIGGVGIVDPVDNENTISAYPNPFTDIITFSSSEHIQSIMIYDIFGRLVFVTKLDKNETSYELNTNQIEQMISGVYFVHIYTNSGNEVVKVIKQ